ncbi:MAG: DsbC family protein [Nitrospirota bacterium]|nr:DsbC family protein [Nitrospirota bacterium]
MLRLLIPLLSVVLFSDLGMAALPELGVKDSIVQRLQSVLPGFMVQKIHPVGDGGIWEVEATTPKGFQVFYTDSRGDVLVTGNAFSLVTLRNITNDVLNRQRAEAVAQIPLNDMLTFGEFVGKPDVLYFTDPDCPYCRQFHGEFEKLLDAGVSVGVVFFVATGKHPDGERKASAVWCAENPREALAQTMAGHTVADAPASCLKPDFSAMKTWGERLGVRGTPGFVLGTGEVVSGKTTASRLKQRLSPVLSQVKGE